MASITRAGCPRSLSSARKHPSRPTRPEYRPAAEEVGLAGYAEIFSLLLQLFRKGSLSTRTNAPLWIGADLGEAFRKQRVFLLEQYVPPDKQNIVSPKPPVPRHSSVESADKHSNPLEYSSRSRAREFP